MDLTDDELARLYDRYAHVLYHRCRALLRNDEEARDAVQETFARVIRNADTFRAQSSPLTWMYRISTNWCLNQIRNRRGRHRKHEDHRAEIGGPSIVSPGDDDDADHARILALLDDADDQTRACVVHTFFDDCTREEVAALVGLSVPTVRKRINTFLDQARRQLGVALVAVAVVLGIAVSWGGSPTAHTADGLSVAHRRSP
ncbi:MAG: sigma-70 family RNA polymerase sigma factor [Myxococcota bacterium]